MSGSKADDLIFPEFPDLSERQKGAFRVLGKLYAEWNQKINVISRKDIENLYERHVLHSLAIAKFVRFKPGSHILDLGTGGGFPGIPLAILMPEVKFHLIDARAKKIKVVEEISEAIEAHNVMAQHIRAEDLKGTYDFVVSRAVAPLEKLVSWSRRLIVNEQKNAIPNGLICLKGGDVKNEIKSLGKAAYCEVEKVNTYFNHPWFEEKSIIYVQL